MDNFSQSVWMTVVGMGLTFAALGLLVLAMLALARWVGRTRVPSEHAEKPSGAGYIDEETQELEQAAAVAVAVALAMAARRIHPSHPWHSAGFHEDVNPWQAYARGQQLEQRKTHQTLRW
jgi:sodium pump decarboxylase gamma subunit